MSDELSTMREAAADSQAAAPAAISPTRPIVWSVRREFWEHRWIYLAPVVTAGVVLLGFLISMTSLSQRLAVALPFDALRRRVAHDSPHDAAAMYIMATALLVGFYYSIEALHGERRDRSILFWKSLPVPDLTAVLAKASIPLVFLPLLTVALIAVTQLIMLMLQAGMLLMSGGTAAAAWTQLPPVRMTLMLIYFLITLTLWHAPIYGWLLLVSAWARRAPLLWALLPPLAIAGLERRAFNTSHVGSMLMHRWAGSLAEAFAFQGEGREALGQLPQLTPGQFVSAPGLWVGLLFTAACLAAAARLRRLREPV